MINRKTPSHFRSIALLSLDFFIIFCSTFSGDYTYAGIPLFFFFWLTIVFRRSFTFKKVEIIAQVFVFFALIPIIVQPYKYNTDYYFGAYYAILYVNVLVFAAYTLEFLLNNTLKTKFLRFLPAISLLCLEILSWNLEGSRQALVFGPNIYYRIIAVLIIVHIILLQEYYTNTRNKVLTSISSLLFTAIFVIAGLYLLVKTGSRGATIVGSFVILFFAYSILNIKKIWLKIGSLALLSYLINSFIRSSNFVATIFSSRTFNYRDPDPSSKSIELRTKFLENISSFFQRDNYLIGEGSSYLYHYPHNLYLDLLYNAGIFPFLILLACTAIYAFLFFSKKLDKKWKYMSLIMSPIYMGSLVSGTLYDNYPIISMMILLPIWIQNYTRNSFDKVT
jgi:O-antigen ligase